MEIKNPLYQNQGIHVICSIFTIEKGVPKVLLIKRKNDPYKDMWALVGGALYNNETIDDGMEREIFEKIGIKLNNKEMFGIFSDVNRSPLMRMIAVGYIGLIDINKVQILKNTSKTSDADWYPLDKIPTLAYDHNEIIKNGMNYLKEKILNSDILKDIYPNGFTLPEIQKVYEIILSKELDRRNFRKKLINLNLIYDTGKTIKYDGNKPAKLYKFKKNNKSVL